MSVILRTMTDDEYEVFYRWSVEQQAEELMEEHQISRQSAIKEAETEIAQMLPRGLHTEQNHLLTIEECDSKRSVGFIWTVHEETSGRKQSFICDFAIWESERLKGYGAAALCLSEKLAAEAGCRESVLFVADRNAAARALYIKCGYRSLRRQSYGAYLVKQLL